AIVMVEGGAQEVPEADVLEALFYAHQELQAIIEMQVELQSKVGKTKIEFVAAEYDKALAEKMSAFVEPKLKEAIKIGEKLARREAVGAAQKALIAEFVKAEDLDASSKSKLAGKVFEDTHYDVVRGMALDSGVRLDGRNTTTVRPISVEVGLLPR